MILISISAHKFDVLRSRRALLLVPEFLMTLLKGYVACHKFMLNVGLNEEKI
jgi:hypothetical protein